MANKTLVDVAKSSYKQYVMTMAQMIEARFDSIEDDIIGAARHDNSALVSRVNQCKIDSSYLLLNVKSLTESMGQIVSELDTTTERVLGLKLIIEAQQAAFDEQENKLDRLSISLANAQDRIDSLTDGEPDIEAKKISMKESAPKVKSKKAKS